MDADEANQNQTSDDVDEASSGGTPPYNSLPDPFDAESTSDALRLLEELGAGPTEESLLLMPKLLSFLNHDDPGVVKESITCGTRLLRAVMEEMGYQLRTSGDVEEWLDQMWYWMVQFKDAVSSLVLEPLSIGIKALAVKFLEVCVLYFTSDVDVEELPLAEGRGTSWLVQGHPILDPALLEVEANKIVFLLVDVLQSANTLYSSFTIVVINCLAAIARGRPLHYNRILSALLGFNHKVGTLDGCHSRSIRHSLKTALVGFLRCSHRSIVESRDKLFRALRSMNPSEATEQIIRQVEKMPRSTERASRDTRISKDDFAVGHMPATDVTRKRPLLVANDTSDDMSVKRTRLTPTVMSTHPDQVVSDLQDDDASNEFHAQASLVDNGLSPARKMLSMIGALLAEGERGVESLELLVSNIHADLLADIVIETMKHLPEVQLDMSFRNENPSADEKRPPSTVSSEVDLVASATIPAPSTPSSLQHTFADNDIGKSTDTPSFHNLHADSKRDLKRDPRRLDPRRLPESTSQHSVPLNLENNGEMQPELPHSLSKDTSASESVIKADGLSEDMTPRKEMELPESSVCPSTDQLIAKSLNNQDENIDIEPALQNSRPLNSEFSPVHDSELVTLSPLDITANECINDDLPESDQYPSSVSTGLVSEDTCHDLPTLPLYVDLADEQKKALCKLAVTRIIEGHKQIRATGCGQACLPLLARLVAQMDADDDIIALLQKHIILDYHHQKGHDLAMHILYYLRTTTIFELDEDSSTAANNYEKFLLAIAKALIDSLPASDKSLSRLLGEAPLLPDSALRLLEDLCQSRCFDNQRKDICEGDRITQGLGALWSLILGRPLSREACLDIALKCAVHPVDEVRTKAIRLVTNKLYLLNYVSENIERFATSTLLSLVDQQETESGLVCCNEQRTMTVGNQETSISGSHNSEPDSSGSESGTSTHAPTTSFSLAQQKTSLFFALCSKKPSLLQIIFDIYGRSPKAVKQSVHRHVPTLLRNLGSSYTDILHLISKPPEGSDKLIMMVLQILTEESTPSAELITAVKHLYETKLKDAAILIPMLSSLSKEEVLPIFPRLVDLPLEKFQAALARILQGSAHTGPALTPVEVLVAVHEIDPEKHGVALKKITDACTACFEQRTVFTHQVLAKSLSYLVEQVPLPLLFMRTVIQAIDAFPILVDFVMGILSKLVSKQIWKMKKLWAGFLKCVSQTQPHSFHVLLQLPPPHLESALSKYANLKAPLAAFANQSSVKSTLPRQTLRSLGLISEPQQEASRSYLPTSMHASDAGASLHGTTLT